MKNCLTLIFIACALTFSPCIQAQPNHNKQRSTFLKAEKALLAGDRQEYEKLSKKIENYSLYPYLIYTDLKQRMSDLPINEMQAFFTNYPDLPITEKLREEWLFKLAKEEQWLTYIQFYKINKNVKLQCLYAKAKIQVGDTDTANTIIQRLWLIGRSQPNECDYAFNYWKKNHHVTGDLIWQRYKLALNSGNSQLARYLLKSVPSEHQAQAKLMLTIHHSPTIITNEKFLNKSHAKSNEVIYHGLIRLAKRYPTSAKKAWDTTYKNYSFTPQQKQKIISAISSGLMNKNESQAKAWIASLDPKYVTQSVRSWQLRQLLTEQKWQKIQSNIEQLPSSMQQKPIWRYWYARSLEQQKNDEKSQKLFQNLAQERHFYGFLAASRLQKPVSMGNKKLAVDKKEYALLANNMNIQRAYELYQLKRYSEGNDEWWAAIDKLNGKQRYIAAKIADSFGWTRIALATSSRASHKDDLHLLYPTLYSEPVGAEAKRNHINPALLYAMIRQESFFRHSAVSRSGARGLMQLMPSTASYIAKKLSFPYSYIEKLYEPSTNIYLGTAYLQYLFENFEGHPILAIASYNAGPNRVKRWLPQKQPWAMDLWVETIPITETREYVKFVMTFTMIYEHQLGRKPNIKPYLQSIPTKEKK